MVDFGKRLAAKGIKKPTDPIELYDTLDRKHDKGPLRPAQTAVLAKWNTDHQGDRDVIVKLHTGQGKTLIGLLMLQARLNAGKGPALYLCPNNFLIDQTADQAEQFGIRVCTTNDHLPEEFTSARSILVTSVQKLFNGRTKFGLHHESLSVDTLLMDDAHACADAIRNQCRIRIPRDEPAYDALKTLFASDLEQQGQGTFADVENHQREALLPVPYWAWLPHAGDVAQILSTHRERKSIKFAWPLLKDMLELCQCVISGAAVEIEPFLPPLHAFGTYHGAPHRIFMSATVTDDAFLVKGLQLTPKTITCPLTYSKEKWSGEKMILIPSLMCEDLDRGAILTNYGKASSGRRAGRVALVPSFAKAADWEKAGARLAKDDELNSAIEALLSEEYEKTVVLANRYDGIDLPDDACRVLIFDSTPYSENLTDRYEEQCRVGSEATLMRTVRTIEQGMGRSVRGEKDYSAIVVIGADLVRLLRDKRSRTYLSPQMRKQIEIGIEIADAGREEIAGGKEPWKAFQELVGQCLRRDEGWKAFYVEQMKTVTPAGPSSLVLEIFKAELDAESAYERGDYGRASERLQQLVDEADIDDREAGWYLQQRARYLYNADRPQSQKLQVAAHKRNRRLLKPPVGVTVSKLTAVSHGRAERIKAWLSDFECYSDLNVRISDLLSKLVFGTKAEAFEAALDDLSRACGFNGERPDAEWKEGPDNLWALDSNQYLLFECKSEVDVLRSEINKREAEQMNRSAAWFGKHYPGMKVRRIMIHPARKIESAAAFLQEVEGMGVNDLKRLVSAAQGFFKSFENRDLKDISEADIQSLINAHKLQVSDLTSGYARKLKNMK